MAAQQRVYAGVEGGATNTILVLLDDAGRILSRAHGPGTNGYLIGVPAVADILIDLATKAKAEAGLPQELTLESFGACMSGFLEPGPQAELIGIFGSKAPGLSRHYYIDNDSPGSVYTAAGDSGGMVLIAGTGSMGQLLQPGKAPVNCGGHGHMYGDEGSAYSIASSAIRFIFRAIDGYSELDAQFTSCPGAGAGGGSGATAGAAGAGGGAEYDGDPHVPAPDSSAAREAMLRYFEISEPSGMLGVMYGAAFKKDRVAGFTKVLSQLAGSGDDFARWLFARAGRELGAVARTLARALQPEDGGDVAGVSIVCVGSVWKSWPLLRAAFVRAATAPFAAGSAARLQSFKLVRLTETSAVGAGWRAAQLGPSVRLPLDTSVLTETLYQHA